MASGLTHILLTKKLQDKFEDGDLKNILAFAADSFQVGSVAPDLPYASIADNDFIFANESSLADDFHYKLTNQLPLQSLVRLKELKGQLDDEILYHMFSFFLGYISHVLADGIIHPFVRDKVGEYNENQAEHRSLEMQLDVLFFEELTAGSGFASELNYTNIHDEIENFLNLEFKNKIVLAFSDLINAVYGQNYTEDKILGWIKGLHRMFEVAEGDHPRFYRNLKLNTFTFRNREDINREKAVKLEKPKDREINFLEVNEIDYFKDCIPQYYKRFVALAQRAFRFVFEDGPALSEDDIPAINLDTGRLLPANDLNTIPAFWNNSN